MQYLKVHPVGASNYANRCFLAPQPVTRKSIVCHHEGCINSVIAPHLALRQHFTSPWPLLFKGRYSIYVHHKMMSWDGSFTDVPDDFEINDFKCSLLLHKKKSYAQTISETNVPAIGESQWSDLSYRYHSCLQAKQSWTWPAPARILTNIQSVGLTLNVPCYIFTVNLWHKYGYGRTSETGLSQA